MNSSKQLALGHFLSLDSLSRQQLLALLDNAGQFIAGPGENPVRGQDLAGRTVANLFFEPSTRTRASFELAARRLGADLLNFDVSVSSRSKGETDQDTLQTLAAMGVSIFVLRTGVAGLPAALAGGLDNHCALINAGEAEVSHPSQGLLDLFTIRQHKPDLQELRVAIVGDIAHSRVARSAIRGLNVLGVAEIRLIAPPAFQPDAAEMPGCSITTDLDAGLAGVDIVMALRIQRERMALAELPDTRDYFARFGLSESRLQRTAPNALVMHPGPMNRGVEIEDAVADGPRSLVREQVRNGVAVRMALLAAVARGLADHRP